MKGASNLNDVKDCLLSVSQVLALIIIAYVVFIFMHALASFSPQNSPSDHQGRKGPKLILTPRDFIEGAPLFSS